MYGYFASDLEAEALPGGEGVGYIDVWGNLPEGSKISIMGIEDPSELETVESMLAEKGFHPLLLERMKKNAEGAFRPTVYIAPTKPAEINGKQRWAWLEIDMETFDVVSVFDTGERGGMAEYLIGCFPENYAEVGAGALVGITTSVGSVAAFTLSIDDYSEVRKAAQEKCKEIGEHLGTVTGFTGAISAGGKIKEGIGGHELQLAKLFEVVENLWINKLTFDEGYKYAVEAYFGK
jgi:hypothetical protein